MRSKFLFPLSVITLLALTQNASANAGTLLIWTGMFHLAFGNFFIGILEGKLLEKLFGVSSRWPIGMMIVANYFSAWVGGLLIRGWIIDSLPLNLNNGWMWFWLMVPITFVITLILEWPFVAWGFRGKENWIRVSVKASLVVQSASYALLFICYWLASGTSLYTRMNVVPSSQLLLPSAVTVYFIDPRDGNVHRRGLTANGSEKISSLGSSDRNDRLFMAPTDGMPNHWDLKARNGEQSVSVLTNLAVQAAPHQPPGRSTWMNFGKVPRFANSPPSQWVFWAGFWPVAGLHGTKTNPVEEVHFSYETPFGSWIVRNATLLPDDIVLFQLGWDQICAFDPETRKVALLWHGRGPVPVIEQTTPPAPARTPETPP